MLEANLDATVDSAQISPQGGAHEKTFGNQLGWNGIVRVRRSSNISPRDACSEFDCDNDRTCS